MKHILSSILRLFLFVPPILILFLWAQSHREYLSLYRETIVIVTDKGNVEAWRPQALSFQEMTRIAQTTLASDRGLLRFEHSQLTEPRVIWPYRAPLRHPNWRLRTYPVRPYVQNPNPSWRGLAFAHLSNPANHTTTIILRYPHLFALACILPAISLFRILRRRHRRKRNHCTRCNYDLRFSPTRCPECGTPVQA